MERNANAAGILPQHISNDIQCGFVKLSGDDDDDLIHHTETKLRLGSAMTLGLWLSLMVLILTFSPMDSYEAPEGLDRDSHLLTALLLFVVTFVRLLQMLMKERSAGFLGSGIVVSTLCVQSVALVSNMAMALLPCPVLYDAVTGQRSHLFRYAEWTSLAFLMVFLTDNIDSQTQLRFQTAICLGLSTASGFILPLCRHVTTWIAVFVVATILFVEIYLLLYRRIVRFRRIRDKMKKGHLQLTAADHEEYEIARSSFLLTVICSTAWTILVVSYAVVCALPFYVPAEYIPSAALSLHSCANEVLSKIWYLNTLLEAYDTIFDVNTRVSRRLEELRRFMSAIWQSSSDTIIFCVTNHADHISARISPAFLNISGLEIKGMTGKDVTILLEVHPLSGTFSIFGLDLSKPLCRESTLHFRQHFKTSTSVKYNFRDSHDLPEDIQNAATLARHISEIMVARAKSVEPPKTAHHHGVTEDHGLSFSYQGSVMCCESKISTLQDHCMVMVLRDISDRIERFAVEKKLVEEQAIRSKDAETNHFTRHEVKNGILASIGLLDHMRDCMKKKIESLSSPLQTQQQVVARLERSPSSNSLCEVKDPDSGVADTLEELDSTLHDVLDTILDEVMAREIIYGEYKPRKERTDVNDVLSTIRRGSSSRFPLEVYPNPFPLVVLDRQLLRHIYRNAVSNACRYGKFNGQVKTILRYDESQKLLSMKVINEPGNNHDELVKLTDEEVASVFHKGVQLQATKMTDQSEPRKVSSGNGAWIMLKCAETLEGNCTIAFSPQQTEFHFECPVEAVRTGADAAAGEAPAFGLPPGTQCVVVEDSQVQRKLLDRMLQNLGIPCSQRVVLGRDSSEILGFPKKVVEMLKENQKDQFLLIVDENLDIVPNGGVDVETVSGSSLVQELRTVLDPATEGRVLALVRSANDSTKDIELYLSRAHGYLLKEPLKKGQFIEAIKPWWLKRFPHQIQVFSPRSHEEEVCGPLPDDIRAVLDQIHSLCSNPDTGVLARRWSVIRDKLLSLKGDLKTMSSNEKVLEVIQDLEALQKHKKLPEDYRNTWRKLRERIEVLL